MGIPWNICMYDLVKVHSSNAGSRHSCLHSYMIHLILAFLVCTPDIQCKENPYLVQQRMLMINLKEKSQWSRAVFAGGCFWCMEPPFDKKKGVKATISGYAGGSEKNPTYEEVASGKTSHAESILIEYDSKKVSYKELVDIFWKNIDPTQKNGQFHDLGSQYRTAIFYLNEEQRKIAEASKNNLEGSKRFKYPIVTQITPVDIFWKAEEYHQDFYKKNSNRYYDYRNMSGRDRFIEKNWKN